MNIDGHCPPPALTAQSMQEDSESNEATEKPLKTDSDESSSLPQSLGVKHLKYACLAEGCSEGFEDWKDARGHMQRICKLKTKPKLALSAEKAKKLFESPVMNKADGFSGKLKTDRAPTELELVEIIKQYYKAGPACFFYRKDVMSKVIRPMFGNFPFSQFGFGTFAEFSTRHGLCVKPPE